MRSRRKRRIAQAIGFTALLAVVIGVAQFGGVTGGPAGDTDAPPRGTLPKKRIVMSGGLHGSANPAPEIDQLVTPAPEDMETLDSGNAQPLARRGKTGARSPQVRARAFERDVRVRYFTVRGGTPEKIADSIVRHSKEVFSKINFDPPLAKNSVVFGIASSFYEGGSYSWNTVDPNKSWTNPTEICRMTRMDPIRAGAVIVVPRWDAPSKFQPGLRTKWRQFARSVLEHERVHARKTVRTFRRLTFRLRELQHPCGTFNAQVDRMFSRTWKRLSKRQDEFDVRRRGAYTSAWIYLFPPKSGTYTEATGESLPPPPQTTTTG